MEVHKVWLCKFRLYGVVQEHGPRRMDRMQEEMGPLCASKTGDSREEDATATSIKPEKMEGKEDEDITGENLAEEETPSEIDDAEASAEDGIEENVPA